MTGWEMREIESPEDQRSFARIYVNAFTASGRTEEQLAEDMERDLANDRSTRFWGAWEDGRLLGGMAILDLEANFAGGIIRAAGAGDLCVDLTQKRRGVARRLMRFFLDYCRNGGRSLAMLYPFRPDFYLHMGFGYGPKLNEYRLLPSSLQPGGAGGQVSYLTVDDLDAVCRCYETRARAQHGYCLRGEYEMRSRVERSAPRRRLVGCWRDEELTGYLAFDFKRAHDRNHLVNDLEIKEWVWLDPPALASLSGFLSRQSDQINRIIYRTHNPFFHHLLRDVRSDSGNLAPPISHETNTQGVGLMYRVVSVDEFLKVTEHARLGASAPSVNLHVRDSFAPVNSGSYTLGPGNPSGSVDVGIDIADLSSLLMGSVDVESLYRLGRIDMPGEWTTALGDLLRVPGPECVTAF